MLLSLLTCSQLLARMRKPVLDEWYQLGCLFVTIAPAVALDLQVVGPTLSALRIRAAQLDVQARQLRRMKEARLQDAARNKASRPPAGQPCAPQL